MTLQAKMPMAYSRIAGGYSGYWDERARTWWAKRTIDAIRWEPGFIFEELTADDFPTTPERPQYGHPVEREIICPRVTAMRVTLREQFDRGLPIANDSYRWDQKEYSTVRDWLGGLDEKWLSKLWKLSWAQGVEHAGLWHADMERRIKEKKAGDEGVVARVETKMGWTWCRLGTEAALVREGEVMGHCVGHGAYRQRLELQYPGGIWSLRDADGRSVGTIDVNYADSIKSFYVIQASGPANRAFTAEKIVCLDEFRSATGAMSQDQAIEAYRKWRGDAEPVFYKAAPYYARQEAVEARADLQHDYVGNGPKLGETLPAFRQHERRNDRMRGRR